MPGVRWLIPLFILVSAALVGAQGEPLGGSGRAAYASLACWQCHAQERDRGFPAVSGTRLAGPILDQVPQPRSREWHLAHLHNPRAVVVESVMPGYEHLFVPQKNARDIAEFISKHDRDGDGVVAKYELDDEEQWAGLLEAHDTSRNGIISEADAVPAPGPEIENLVAYLIDLAPSPPPTLPGPAKTRPPTDRAKAIDRGQALFARHCAGCHGARADGRGSVAGFFGNHPPRNFLRGQYRYKSTPVSEPPTDLDIFLTIRRGAGPSMPAWPLFTDGQVFDLVEFLKSNHPGYLPRELFVKGAELEFVKDGETMDASGAMLETGRISKRAGRWFWIENGRETEIAHGMRAGGFRFELGRKIYDWMDGFEPTPLDIPDAPVEYSHESAEVGGKIYVELGCGKCHGEEGRGDGQAADETRGSLGQIIKPSDYSRGAHWLKGGADPRSLVRAFFTGLAGTPMPTYLSSFQNAKAASPENAPWHLAHFVMRQAAIPVPR